MSISVLEKLTAEALERHTEELSMDLHRTLEPGGARDLNSTLERIRDTKGRIAALRKFENDLALGTTSLDKLYERANRELNLNAIYRVATIHHIDWTSINDDKGAFKKTKGTGKTKGKAAAPKAPTAASAKAPTAASAKAPTAASAKAPTAVAPKMPTLASIKAPTAVAPRVAATLKKTIPVPPVPTGYKTKRYSPGFILTGLSIKPDPADELDDTDLEQLELMAIIKWLARKYAAMDDLDLSNIDEIQSVLELLDDDDVLDDLSEEEIELILDTKEAFEQMEPEVVDLLMELMNIAQTSITFF